MDKIIEILNNLDKHIIYNKYINSICYSVEFIKAKKEILKMLEQDKRIDKLKREGYIEFERYEIGGNMIEVGEYVRTKNGIIAKTLGFEIETYEDRGDIIYQLDREVFDETEGYEEMSEWVLPDQIKQHSKNIIDLIEVGDYVNGMYIQEIKSLKDNVMECMVDSDYECITTITNKEITTILTKEQYEANCYKVKEE